MEENHQQPEQDSQPGVDYKEKYHALKRKLKALIYEQESFLTELQKAQRKLLKASRDKSFLLDRLLIYEQVTDDSSDDSEATLSSDCESGPPPKRRNAAVTVKSEPTVSSSIPEGGSQAAKNPSSKATESDPPVVKVEFSEENNVTPMQNGSELTNTEVKQEVLDTSLNASDVERLSSSVSESMAASPIDPRPTASLPQDVFE